MKRILIAITSVVLFAGLYSCEKEKSFETGTPPSGDTTGTGGGDSNTTGNFTAKIDGSQWVADKGAGAARVGGLINISGLGLDKKIITMTLVDSGVHQYTLYYDNTAKNAGAFSDSTLQDISSFSTNAGLTAGETGGTVNITAIDETNKTMSGTFSFIVKRLTDGTGRDITEGVFTNLPYNTTLPPANSTDTFKVKIDGVDFVPFSVISFGGGAGFNKIAISGTDASGSKTVSVNLPQDVLPGTYAIGTVFDDYGGQYNVNSSTSLSSTTGTVTILEHNVATKRIRGIFSFSASSSSSPVITAQLTEGSFAVTYQ